MGNYYSEVIKYKISTGEYLYGLLIHDIIITSINSEGITYIPANQLEFISIYDIGDCGDKFHKLYGRFIEYRNYDSDDLLKGVVIFINEKENRAKVVEYLNIKTGRIVINEIQYSRVIQQ